MWSASHGTPSAPAVLLIYTGRANHRDSARAASIIVPQVPSSRNPGVQCWSRFAIKNPIRIWEALQKHRSTKMQADRQYKRRIAYEFTSLSYTLRIVFELVSRITRQS